MGPVITLTQAFTFPRISVPQWAWSAAISAGEPDALLSEGLANAERAIQCDNRDAVSYFSAGRIHMMLGNHDESIGAIKTALELNPSFAHANHALGFVLTLAGDYEPAKRAAQKAIQLSPRDPALWAFKVCRALTFLLAGETEDAGSHNQSA